MMKRRLCYMISLIGMLALCLTGCGERGTDPGAPPAEVLHPEETGQIKDETNEDSEKQTEIEENEDSSRDILTNAVAVRIGLMDRTSYEVDMIDNDATNTMLNYLSGSEMRFPAYTYDEEEGYVAQNIRGSYTQDDEEEIVNISAGDLYLFSGGQLRLYFSDIEGANIIATPVGYFEDAEAIKTAVPRAYEENRDDTWNVDVYFLITRN